MVSPTGRPGGWGMIPEQLAFANTLDKFCHLDQKTKQAEEAQAMPNL